MGIATPKEPLLLVPALPSHLAKSCPSTHISLLQLLIHPVHLADWRCAFHYWTSECHSFTHIYNSQTTALAFYVIIFTYIAFAGEHCQ